MLDSPDDMARAQRISGPTVGENRRREKGQDKILLRGPSEVLDAFDAYADELDVTRAEALRRLLILAGKLQP